MKEFLDALFDLIEYLVKKYPIWSLTIITITIGIWLQDSADDIPSVKLVKEEAPLLSEEHFVNQCKNIVREKIGVPVTFAHRSDQFGAWSVSEGRMHAYIYFDIPDKMQRAECFFNDGVLVNYSWKNREWWQPLIDGSDYYQKED